MTTRSRMRLVGAWVTVTLVFPVAVAVGCGGKIDPNATLGSSGSDRAGGTTAGGSGSGSGGGGSGGSGGASSGSTGGGAGSSSGSSAPAAIACGKTTCDSATQECCITVNGGGGRGGGGIDETCTKRDACDGDLALSCSDSKSCKSGQVCCLSPQDGASSCVSSCDTGGGGPGGSGGPGDGASVQLCSTDAECPKGERCQPTPMGFGFCRGRGGGGGGPGGGRGG